MRSLITWTVAITMVTSMMGVPTGAMGLGEAPPDAYFTVDPGTGTTQTVFTVDTRGSHAPTDATFVLDWGDGSTTTWTDDASVQTHRYDAAGTFSVTLRIEAPGEASTAYASVRVDALEPPEAANQTSQRLEEDPLDPDDAVEIAQTAPPEDPPVGTIVSLVPGLEPAAFPDALWEETTVDFVDCTMHGCMPSNASSFEDPSGDPTAAFSVLLQRVYNAHHHVVDITEEDGTVNLHALSQGLGYARHVGADVTVALIEPSVGLYDAYQMPEYAAYTQEASPVRPASSDRVETVTFFDALVDNKARYDVGGGFAYTVQSGYNASQPIAFTGPVQDAHLRASEWDLLGDGNDLGHKGQLGGAGELKENGCAPLPLSPQAGQDVFPLLPSHRVFEESVKLHQRLAPADLAHLGPTKQGTLERVGGALDTRVCLELMLNWLAREGMALFTPAGDTAHHEDTHTPSEATWDAQTLAGLAQAPQAITVGATTSHVDGYDVKRVLSPFSAAGPTTSLEHVKPDLVAPGDIPTLILDDLDHEPARVYDLDDAFEHNRTFGSLVDASNVTLKDDRLHVEPSHEGAGVVFHGLRTLPPDPVFAANVNIHDPGDDGSQTAHLLALQEGVPVDGDGSKSQGLAFDLETSPGQGAGYGLSFQATGDGSVHVSTHVWDENGEEYCPPSLLGSDCQETSTAPSPGEPLDVLVVDEGPALEGDHHRLVFQLVDQDGSTLDTLTRHVPVDEDDRPCACQHAYFLASNVDEDGAASGAEMDEVMVTGLGREAVAEYVPGLFADMGDGSVGVRPTTQIATAYVAGTALVESQTIQDAEDPVDHLQQLRGRLAQLSQPLDEVPGQVQGAGELRVEEDLDQDEDEGLIPDRQLRPDAPGLGMGRSPWENTTREERHHDKDAFSTERLTDTGATLRFHEVPGLDSDDVTADTSNLAWHRIDADGVLKATSEGPQLAFEREQVGSGTWAGTLRVDEAPPQPGVYATHVEFKGEGTFTGDWFSRSFTLPVTLTHTVDATINLDQVPLPEGASAWLLPPTDPDHEGLIYQPYPGGPSHKATVKDATLDLGPIPHAAYSLNVFTNASLPVPWAPTGDAAERGEPRSFDTVSPAFVPEEGATPLLELDEAASLPVPVAYRFLDIQQGDAFESVCLATTASPEQATRLEGTSCTVPWNKRGDAPRGAGHALADPLPRGHALDGWQVTMAPTPPPPGLGPLGTDAVQGAYHDALGDEGAFAYTSLKGHLDTRVMTAKGQTNLPPVTTNATFDLPSPAEDLHGTLKVPLDLEEAHAFVTVSTGEHALVTTITDAGAWLPESPQDPAWPADEDTRDPLHQHTTTHGLLGGNGHVHATDRVPLAPQPPTITGHEIPISFHEIPPHVDALEVSVTVVPKPASTSGDALTLAPTEPLPGPRFTLEGVGLYAWTQGTAERVDDALHGLDAGPALAMQPHEGRVDPLQAPVLPIATPSGAIALHGELFEAYVQGPHASIHLGDTPCPSGPEACMLEEGTIADGERLRFALGHAMGPVYYPDLDTQREHTPYGEPTPLVHPAFPLTVATQGTHEHLHRVNLPAIQQARTLHPLTFTNEDPHQAPLPETQDPVKDRADPAPPPATVPDHCILPTAHGLATILAPQAKRACTTGNDALQALEDAPLPEDIAASVAQTRSSSWAFLFDEARFTVGQALAQDAGCPHPATPETCLDALLVNTPPSPEGTPDPLWEGPVHAGQNLLVLQSLFEDEDGTAEIIVEVPDRPGYETTLATVNATGGIASTAKTLTATQRPGMLEVTSPGDVHAVSLADYHGEHVTLTAQTDDDAWSLPRVAVESIATLWTLAPANEPTPFWEDHEQDACPGGSDPYCLAEPVGVQATSTGHLDTQWATAPPLEQSITPLLDDALLSLTGDAEDTPFGTFQVPPRGGFLVIEHEVGTDEGEPGPGNHVRLEATTQASDARHVLTTIEGDEALAATDEASRLARLDVYDVSAFTGHRLDVHANITTPATGPNTTWHVHDARLIPTASDPGHPPIEDAHLTQRDHPTQPTTPLHNAPTPPGDEDAQRVGPAQAPAITPGTVHAPEGLHVTQDTTIQDAWLIVGTDAKDQGATIHVQDEATLSLQNVTITPRHADNAWGLTVDEGATLNADTATFLQGGHPQLGGSTLHVEGTLRLDDARLLSGRTGLHVAPQASATVQATTVHGFHQGIHAEGSLDLVDAFVDANHVGLTAHQATVTVDEGLFTNNRDAAINTQDALVAIDGATFAWNGAPGESAALRTIEGLETGSVVVHDATFLHNTDAVHARSNITLHDATIHTGKEHAAYGLHAAPGATVHAHRVNVTTNDVGLIADAGATVMLEASYVEASTPIACATAGDPTNLTIHHARITPIEGPPLPPGLEACAWTNEGAYEPPEDAADAWRGLAADRFTPNQATALVLPLGTQARIVEDHAHVNLTLDPSTHTILVDANRSRLPATVPYQTAAPEEPPTSSVAVNLLTVDPEPPTASITIDASTVDGWTQASSIPMSVHTRDAGGSGVATTSLHASTLRADHRPGLTNVTVQEGHRGDRFALGQGSLANLPLVTGEETRVSAMVTDRAGNTKHAPVESIKVDATPPRAWVHADDPCVGGFAFDAHWRGHDPERGSDLRDPDAWPPEDAWSYAVHWAPLDASWLGLGAGLNLTPIVDTVPEDEALAFAHDVASAFGFEGDATVTPTRAHNVLANAHEPLGLGALPVGQQGHAGTFITPEGLEDANVLLPSVPATNPQRANALMVQLFDMAHGLPEATGENRILSEDWGLIGLFTKHEEHVRLSPLFDPGPFEPSVTLLLEENPYLDAAQAEAIVENVNETVTRLDALADERRQALQEAAVGTLVPPERVLVHQALSDPRNVTTEDQTQLFDLVNETLTGLHEAAPVPIALSITARDAVGNHGTWHDAVLTDLLPPVPVLNVHAHASGPAQAPVLLDPGKPGPVAEIVDQHADLTFTDLGCGLDRVMLDLGEGLVETVYPRDGTVALTIHDVHDLYPKNVCGERTFQARAFDHAGREANVTVDTLLDRKPPLVDLVDVHHDPLMGSLALDPVLEEALPEPDATSGWVGDGVLSFTLDVDSRNLDGCPTKRAPIHEVSMHARVNETPWIDLGHTHHGTDLSADAYTNATLDVTEKVPLASGAFPMEAEDLSGEVLELVVKATDEAGHQASTPLEETIRYDPLDPVCSLDELGLASLGIDPELVGIDEDVDAIGGITLDAAWSAMDPVRADEEAIRAVFLVMRASPASEEDAWSLHTRLEAPNGEGPASLDMDQSPAFVSTTEWNLLDVTCLVVDNAGNLALGPLQHAALDLEDPSVRWLDAPSLVDTLNVTWWNTTPTLPVHLQEQVSGVDAAVLHANATDQDRDVTNDVTSTLNLTTEALTSEEGQVEHVTVSLVDGLSTVDAIDELDGTAWETTLTVTDRTQNTNRSTNTVHIDTTPPRASFCDLPEDLVPLGHDDATGDGYLPLDAFTHPVCAENTPSEGPHTSPLDEAAYQATIKDPHDEATLIEATPDTPVPFGDHLDVEGPHAFTFTACDVAQTCHTNRTQPLVDLAPPGAFLDAILTTASTDPVRDHTVHWLDPTNATHRIDVHATDALDTDDPTRASGIHNVTLNHEPLAPDTLEPAGENATADATTLPLDEHHPTHTATLSLPTLTEGTPYRLHATAMDRVGHENTTTFHDTLIVLDETPPTVTLEPLPAFINTVQIPVDATVVDAAPDAIPSGLEAVHIHAAIETNDATSPDERAYEDRIVDDVLDTQHAVPTAWGGQTVTLCVDAFDRAGNHEPCPADATASTFLDLQAPNATLDTFQDTLIDGFLPHNQHDAPEHTLTPDIELPYDGDGSPVSQIRLTITHPNGSTTTHTATTAGEPIPFPVNQQGDHEASVIACDEAGNCQQTPDAVTYRVDLTAPETSLEALSHLITTTQALDAQEVFHWVNASGDASFLAEDEAGGSGAANLDVIVQPLDPVHLEPEGEAFQPEEVSLVEAEGLDAFFEALVSSSLVEEQRAYRFHVNATDRVGNAEDRTRTLRALEGTVWAYDAYAPVAVIDPLGDWVTKTTITLTGNLSDASGGVDGGLQARTFQVLVDGEPQDDLTRTFQALERERNVSQTLDVEAWEGQEVEVCLGGVDAVGNVGACDGTMTVPDWTPPSVGLTDLAEDLVEDAFLPVNEGTASFEYTFEPAVAYEGASPLEAVTFTLTDPMGDTQVHVIEGAAYEEGDAFTFTWGPEGAYEAVLEACDEAGNCQDETLAFTVDLTPPVPSLGDLDESLVAGGFLPVTEDTTPRGYAFAPLVDNPGQAPIQAVNLTVVHPDGATSEETLTGDAFRNGEAITVPYGDEGAYEAVLDACDVVGNCQASSLLGFSVDLTPPALELAPDFSLVDGDGFPDRDLRVRTSVTDEASGVAWAKVAVTNLSDPGEPTETFSITPGEDVATVLDYEVMHRGEYALSLTAVDRLSQAGIEDDFTMGLDEEVWTVVGGGIGDACGSAVGETALRFKASNARHASTQPLPVAEEGTVSFWLRMPHMGSSCERADGGEGVELEYRTSEGEAWETMASYEPEDHRSWTFIEEPIPAGAVSSSTAFRWEQRSWSSASSSFDHWALDGVEVEARGNVNGTGSLGFEALILPEPVIDFERDIEQAGVVDDMVAAMTAGEETLISGERLTVPVNATAKDREVNLSLDFRGTQATATGQGEALVSSLFDLSQPEHVALHDAFEEGIQEERWERVTGSVNDACGSTVGDEALMFDGSTGSEAITKPRDVAAGGMLSFDMRWGDGGLGSDCDDDSDTTSVRVYYRTSEGGAWERLDIIWDTEGSDWTRYAFELPEDAWGPGTSFRWVQIGNGDDWALDDVTVEATTHAMTVRATTPEGSWNETTVPVDVSADPVIANSSLESNAEAAWTFEGETVGVSEDAARLGDVGVNLTAKDDGEVPRASFSVGTPMVTGHFWAFVRVDEAPVDGAFRVLELQSEAGETVFSYKIEEDLSLWALDGGAWVDTGEVLMEGSWYKVEVRIGQSTTDALLDGLLIHRSDLASTMMVADYVVSATDDSVHGGLHVDDVGAAMTGLVSRELVDTEFWSSVGWTNPDTGLPSTRDSSPPTGWSALHLDSERASHSLWKHLTPAYWMKTNVGHFVDEGRGCPGPGNLVSIVDEFNDLVFGLRCVGDKVEALSSESWEATDGTLSSSSFSQIRIAITTLSASVFVDDQWIGEFPLSSLNPAEEIHLGGGDAELWYDYFLLHEGEHILSDTVNALDDRFWEIQDSSESATIERVQDQRFVGETSFLVEAEGGSGETATLSRPISPSPGTHFVVEGHYHIPDGASYDLFDLLKLHGSDGSEFGVALDTSLEGDHNILVKDAGSDEYDSVDTVPFPGWYRVSIIVNQASDESVFTVNFLDLNIATEREATTAPIERAVAGDTRDAALGPSGSGTAHVDDVSVYSLNTRPVLSFEEPVSGSTVPKGTVMLEGIVSQVDFSDSLEKLEIKVEGQDWEEIPKGPEWFYEWDTSSYEVGTEKDVSLRAHQGSHIVGEEATFTIEE